MKFQKLVGLLLVLGVWPAASTPPRLRVQAPGSLWYGKEDSRFWLEDIKHEGTSPFYVEGWKVFRNVKDYSAKGDGITDDTAAIQRAIDDGNRPNHPGGTTGAPALVYLPAGTYRVSKTLQLWLQTSLVGDPLSKPIIKPTDSLGGNYVINVIILPKS